MQEKSTRTDQIFINFTPICENTQENNYCIRLQVQGGIL